MITRSAELTTLFQSRKMAAIVARKGSATAPRLTVFSVFVISCILVTLRSSTSHTFVSRPLSTRASCHFNEYFLRRAVASAPGRRRRRHRARAAGDDERHPGDDRPRGARVRPPAGGLIRAWPEDRRYRGAAPIRRP